MTSVIRTNIGSALLSLRKSKTLSMREAAEELKISQSAYSQYERGSSIPDIKTIFYASNYYHINIQFLVFLICIDLASLENIKNENLFQLFTFDNIFDWDFFHVKSMIVCLKITRMPSPVFFMPQISVIRMNPEKTTTKKTAVRSVL